MHGASVCTQRQAFSGFCNLYPSLRRVAADLMRRERFGHTLQPTALAHEAYLRLMADHRQNWTDDRHFFSTMVRYMRNVLVDHARKRLSERNGGQQRHVPLNEFTMPGNASEPVLRLDEIIQQLESIDGRVARIVELSYFGGFTHEEIAGLLGVTTRTVQRDWEFARAWFHDLLLRR
jgi:RNA polymerase sigma-70 factor (ECF subfamily)